MAVTRRAPRSFTILGQRFEVHTFAHLQDEDGQDLAGDIDHMTHEVRLMTHQADDELAESLLHEVLHGIYRKAGIDTETKEHEDEVNRLAPILLLFLRSNPRVYTFLTGRETYR